MLNNRYVLSIPNYSLIIFLILIGLIAVNGDVQKEFYIVFMRDDPVNEDSVLRRTHIDVLSALKGSDLEARDSLVYSYTKSFNAFAAKLSQDEADKLSTMDGVLNVFRNRRHELHTTRSWDFIGFPETARRKLKMESDIIVGLLDTGITPQSESFKDDGLGAPPKKWKGSCHQFANFSGCNKKIIGAKYYKLDQDSDPSDILSPVDVDGHGTHTSSTLAGSLIPKANLYGLAEGTARGAVPSARIAVYKVCWASYGCMDMDILAAFDDAIHDGVDVISISIGGATGRYSDDSIAVGSFRAMRKGIITVASAGNDGPSLSTLSNHAPWMFTVAASSIDRQFRSKVVLDSGPIVTGIGVNTFDPKQKLYPLARGGDVAKNSASKDSAGYCMEDSMDPKKVKGKVVYCKLSRWGADSVIKELGGIGAIVQSDMFLDTAQIFMTPGTLVNSSIGETISKYISSSRSPSGVIYKSQEVNITAPLIASFSSRGPNPGSQHLLKPDIAAPGIDILASFTPLRSLTGLKGDTQFSKFTLMSGTSMACPHIAGVAAYVKSFHPTWSPSEIKSAIMTTAKPMSSRKNNHAEFAYGAGQVNPTRALSPGLVYDMDDISYLQFLCHEGYNGSKFGSLVGSDPINCSTLVPGIGEDAINYPTMQLSLKNDKNPATGVFRRTVTNVGPPVSVYNATIRAPKGVEISVNPTSLLFSHAMEKKSFKVVVKAKPMKSTQILVSGSLIWRSSRHIVRSPIVIYSPQD